MYRFPGCCFSAVFSVCYLCRNMLSCQYTFEGKCFCIYTRDSAQLLIVPELSSKENYWIQNQRTDLKAGEEIRHLMETYEKNKKLKDYEAVMGLITRANWEQMEEEKKMCDAVKELFEEELKEADEKGMEKGMELAKRIFTLSAQGISAESIAKECNVTMEQVKKLLA